ncbi:hypothetical protein [Sphingomonas sp. BK235]|uniref:hypothetical protein n=1 Tax=Sphingomonas sp. BK235 TaxID=2512131 RepID=UPI00104C599B|nr:hypothetical protein [Sphingomonas sp. BK235]TCP37521.1 hypothetical protein EV292_1011045 [Sphingomonas sp. BK235]
MIDAFLVTNIVTSLLCAGVLVQTVRLSRAVRTLRQSGLVDVVQTLEAATAASQQALSALGTVLATDGPTLDAAVRDGRAVRDQLHALRDELSLMIDIGNGVADRILAAADTGKAARHPADAAVPLNGATAPDRQPSPAPAESGAEGDAPPKRATARLKDNDEAAAHDTSGGEPPAASAANGAATDVALVEGTGS